MRADADIRATAEKLGAGFDETRGEARFLGHVRRVAGALKQVAMGPPGVPVQVQMQQS